MDMKELIASYQSNIIQTVEVLGLCVAVYFSVKLLLSVRRSKPRLYGAIVSRVRYVLMVFAVILLFQIWVEGFFEVLAVIGFFAAALTITQKDNLLNLIGWLIINWRDLFIEGDMIKIGTNVGVVRTIGFLYITLNEVGEGGINETTGRTIKIPNGMISKNAVMNFSAKKTHRFSTTFVFSLETELQQIEKMIPELIEDVKSLTHNTYLEGSESVQFEFSFSFIQVKPAGIGVHIHFYAPYHLKNRITELLQIAFIKRLQQDNKLKIASAS